MIVQVTTFNDDWLRMRQCLWSDSSLEEHREEIDELLTDSSNCAQFLAFSKVRMLTRRLVKLELVQPLSKLCDLGKGARL
jgi:hypothetical protein